MTNKKTDQVGAYSGIVGVLLLILGFVFGSTAGSSCDMTTAAVSRCIMELRTNLALGDFLNGLAAMFFLIFAGRLYLSLKKAEGDEAWLSIVVFASAAIWAGLWLVGRGIFISSVGLADYYNNPEGARTIFALADEFQFGRGASLWFLPIALMIGGTYLIAKPSGLFSKALYRYSGISALLVILASGMYSIQGTWLILPVLLLFYIWIFWISLAIYRNE